MIDYKQRYEELLRQCRWLVSDAIIIDRITGEPSHRAHDEALANIENLLRRWDATPDAGDGDGEDGGGE